MLRSYAQFTIRFVVAMVMATLLSPVFAHAVDRPSYRQDTIQQDTIQGVVLDSSGRPVEGAEVTLLGDRLETPQRSATDRNGGFFFFGVASGQYTVMVEVGSQVRIERNFLFRQSAVAGVTLTLRLTTHELNEPVETGMFSSRRTNPVQAGKLALPDAGAPGMSVTQLQSALRGGQAAPKTMRTTMSTASTATVTSATNTAADFSIYSKVLASNPVPFGFNMSSVDSAGISDNHFIPAGGMTPYDARLALTATGSGTTTTFLCDDSSGIGTDFYQSIASGFLVGAQSRVYRFTNNAWTLVRTGVISGYTAVSGSPNPADHTITFSTAGATTQKSDVIWMSLDAVSQVPGLSMLDPRFTTYSPSWVPETGGLTRTNPVAPYTLDSSIPPAYNYNGPAGAPGLSLKFTDTTAEKQGIWQYMQPQFMGTQDGFESGHTYEVSVWLKQSGVADGSMTFSFTGLGLFHTFTGVNGNWQHFTWDFAAVPNLPAGSTVPSVHFDFNAPGTMWYDNIQMYDITAGRQTDNLDPRLLAAFQAFRPGTMRIWSNFSSSAGSYQFWSLDSWLSDEQDSRSNPYIGNQYETTENIEHLPMSLAYAKQIGASPWIIVSMSLSEQEWSNLVDYLCAPAGQGYATARPASHPGPYTADFSTIYVEFGNEEWGTQSTPVNGDYGQWMHLMLSQAIAGKSYFDPTKIKFIGNSFTMNPSFASTAARAAPEVGIFDYYGYASGDTSLTGDPYYQSDLLQLPATNKSLVDRIVATQQSDAAAGYPYQVAVYESGPGADVPSHLGDTSLAAGVMTLDVDLYSSLQGFGPQNFFLFNIGTGPYSSHSTFASGLVPHPVWEALQMRNQYANGPMVLTWTNQVPTTADANAYPLLATYAFHDTSSGSDVAEVFVISRDLNNTTPVTLHFPGVPSGISTLYTLTGNPRGNNDSGLVIPIASSSVTVSQDYTFNMPPGSVYLFVVPTGAWSTTLPMPTAPANLAATPGAGQVSLSWSSVSEASSYNVKRSLTFGGPYTTVGSTASVAYADKNLTNGTTYYYVVTAVNSSGESPNSNQATATPNVAVAQYTATPPPIDGTSSTVWNNATSYTYQHKNSGNTPDTGTFKLMWDAQNLYVLATIMDSSPAQSTSVFNGDSVELYIDGNDSKPTTYGANDFQFAFPWNGTTVTEAAHNATQGVSFGQINVSGGYQMTVALPWSTLQVASPATGNLIGFDTMVNDANPANTRIGKIAWWATSDMSWQDPALFGNAILSGGPTPSAGTLLAYEPFNVTPGALNGVSDGSGWNGAWLEQNGTTGYQVNSGTPLAQGSLLTQGNYAGGGYAYETAGRLLNVSSTGPFATILNSQNLIGASGNTIWASFLLRKDANNSDPVWIALHPSPTAWYINSAPVEAGYFGGSGTQYWSLYVNGTIYQTSIPVVIGQTVELVLGINFGSTNTVQLYVNPPTGASAPATASASASTTSAIAFQGVAFMGGYTTGGGSVDEIRLGTSFSSVTPSAGTLLAYEPFNVTPGALNGVSDGSGWNGAWLEQNGTTGYQVNSGTPLAQGSLLTQGNYAGGGYAYETAGRLLNVSSTGPFATILNSQNLIGASGNTIWASFLLRKDANNSDPVWIALHPSPTAWYINSAPVEAGYFGGSGTQYWSLYVNGTIYQTSIPVVIGQTVELVLGINFGSTNTVQLYVNPPTGASAPATASASASTTSAIAFQGVAFMGGYTTGGGSVDEIRLGTSFSSVTPTY